MRICIDPGHGMSNRDKGVYDPGAVGAGVEEADVALAWAKTLAWVLRKDGHSVYLTRDEHEDDLPLIRRAKLARLANCTHFLSIHANAAGNPLASGTETIHRDAPVWASRVQMAALDAMKRPNRGVKTEKQLGRVLAVLGAPNPCLLEIGFISNATDRKLMLARETRLAFAESLAGRLKS